ncbi:DUF3298 and DUF4163 domain-containing protein [Thermomonas carbonis]|uniref:DUF3298 domain-containing protein n=1 Tax=Thermomonas carbonis TaxID=1463158 RepID=A0A7G9SQ11_9GAMM|nr:DUF3298 and DUF4163 domain-containing protein [Thermomonas carbonis]QNN69936.1 hypothetical protein H9L16_15055 [Thermomonas carbonis]GHB96471.1 hypothetical protein GCM10010080_05470 [Thermomonas carbonis]
MIRRSPTFALAFAFVLVLIAGCGREDAPPTPSATSPDAQPPGAVAAPVALQDVIETKPDYIVGISYPQGIGRHPMLAQALQAYAESARAELMQAVAGLQGRKPSAPYDLSLQFTGLVDTPRIVAAAADGSSYTGGAHGNPLVQRFVWLPQRNEMLAAQQLIVDAAGWKTVSDYSREQLMTALSQQLDEDALEGDERAQMLRSGSRMIEGGTAPSAENFARFEPVMNADGSIRALRFVFPPAQVGPYSDGTRSVDVPAQVLLPLVAPDYKPLFRAG